MSDPEDRVVVMRRVITVRVEIDAIAGEQVAADIERALFNLGVRLASGWGPRVTSVIDELRN